MKCVKGEKCFFGKIEWIVWIGMRKNEPGTESAFCCHVDIEVDFLPLSNLFVTRRYLFFPSRFVTLFYSFECSSVTRLNSYQTIHFLLLIFSPLSVLFFIFIESFSLFSLLELPIQDIYFFNTNSHLDQ